MKKIFLLIMIFISAKVFGQFPSEQSMGSPKTQVYSKGSFGSDSGFIYRSCFTDTIQANRGFIKNIPGIKIRTCDDNEWMRNNTAVKWILTGSSSGFINPMTTFGDMIVGKNFGVPIRIAQVELNAKEFGVVGDGVTDDADSLQKFLNYCVNNNVNGIIPGGQYKITKTLYIGDSTTAYDPYKQTSITIRGVGPSKDPDDISADNHGTLILMTGTGKQAIISLEKGLSRYFRLKDLTVSCATEGGAEYGVRMRTTFFSQHEISTVHSFGAVKAFGITNPGTAGGNGEFITFDKCVGSATTNFFYMDSLSGQSFNHLFLHCIGNVKNGGSYFDIGGPNLGYNLTAIEFNSSPNGSITTGLRLLNNRGVSGNINFIGGRNEGLTTLLYNHNVSYNEGARIVFKGMFLHINSTASVFGIYSDDNPGIYNVSVENCVVAGVFGGTKVFTTSIGRTGDLSQYRFTACHFFDYDSISNIKARNPYIQFNNCTHYDYLQPPVTFNSLPDNWNPKDYTTTPSDIYYTSGNVGIGDTLARQKLEVTGNIRLSGALMPGGNAGAAGDFYLSGGAGSPGTWTSNVANKALSNLASVSINTHLIPQSNIDIGATATPFRDGYFSSAIKGTGSNFDITSAATDGYIFLKSTGGGSVQIQGTGGEAGALYQQSNTGALAVSKFFGTGVKQLAYGPFNSSTIAMHIGAGANDGTLGSYIKTDSAGVLNFFSKGSAERMRLTAAGNLAIGNILPTPDSMLTVQHGLFVQRGVRFTNLPATAQSRIVMMAADGSLASVDTTGLFSGGGGGAGTVTSVSGTTNRITSTGGATPVIDISSSYVGQSSITTHGTITSGGLGTGAVIGGVTMTLGSDATGDLYYRSGGILTRIATGTSKQALHPNGSGAYVWRDTVTLDFDSIGDYTPTLYNTTNVTTSTAYPTMWQTQGGGIRITVTGQVLVDPTSAGAVVLGIEIPFATSLAQNYSLNGVAVSEITGEPAYITADTTNNRALLQFTATSTASRTYKITFTYDYAPS